jgi:hypothetical protein
LAGTTWAGRYETVTSPGGDQGCPYEQKVVTLGASGYVDYSLKCSADGPSQSYRGREDNSRWSGTATSLTLSFNNGFSVCSGSVAGTTMSGQCHNAKGEEFRFKFLRTQ